MPFALRIALETLAFWLGICAGVALFGYGIRRVLGWLFASPWRDERP